MTISEDHFTNEKRQHTEIKHKLFYDTFNAILGISAKFSRKNSFTYLDLYAGQGKFNDDTLGSPMLALSTILDSQVTNSFHQIKCFFSEANSTSYSELEKNIENLKTNNKSSSNIVTTIKSGEWNENIPCIDELLKYSKWGFIFIDPFANEINLNELLELLKERTKFKDFMLFINLQALKRIVGRYPNNIGVANFLGIKPNELSTISMDNDTLTSLIKKRFEIMNKDYIINASIPTTKESKLVDKDNFQLLLGTNSIGVSDTFLASYIEAIKEFKDSDTFQCSLFDFLGNDIIKIVKKKKTINLKNLLKELYGNYNSWKNADIYSMPVSKNIHKSLNLLILEKRIKIIKSPEKFINKNKTLKYDAYNRNSYMKEIILE